MKKLEILIKGCFECPLRGKDHRELYVCNNDVRNIYFMEVKDMFSLFPLPEADSKEESERV